MLAVARSEGAEVDDALLTFTGYTLLGGDRCEDRVRASLTVVANVVLTGRVVKFKK